MSEYIKNILTTQGWREIEEMFDDTIEKSATLNDLPKEAPDEVVAREARVKGEVHNKLKGLLSRIKLAGVDTPPNKPKVLV